MLYIQQGMNPEWCGWHVGEDQPMITEKVVTFQADGTELDILIDAIKVWSRKEENQCSKQQLPFYW